MATWCKEVTHLKRPWCWERLKAGGEEDDTGCDVWMASPNRWTWIWSSSGNWWWTGKPGMLQPMGLQRVRHDWVTELNWFLFGKYFHLFYNVSCSVTSDWLRPHGLQHARLPCPSPSSRACSNSCPLNHRCHPTIASLCCEPFHGYEKFKIILSSFKFSCSVVSDSLQPHGL